MNVEPILSLRNDHLAYDLLADATATLTDLATGERRAFGPVALQEDGLLDVGHIWVRTGRSQCEQYPGRFVGVREGDVLRWTLLGRLGKPVGRFAARYSLDGPWLRVQMVEADAELPQLTFPTPLEATSLILPRGIGLWKREPFQERLFWTWYSQLAMRWFGGLNGDDHGWLCVVDGRHHDAGVMLHQFAATPVWRKSLDTWSGLGSVRYRFTRGGVVGVAKAYRAWAKQYGLHRPLADKAADNPVLRQLIGGRIFGLRMAMPRRAQNFEDRMQPVPAELVEERRQLRVNWTFEAARAFLPELRAAGWRKGLLMIRGWIPGGYDATHPDVWPPEVAVGSPRRLRELIQDDPAFTVCLHDNYLDIYEASPSFPQGVIRLRNGDLMPAGAWAGGQAYAVGALAGLEYAKRNLEEYKKVGLKALFPDTLTAHNLYEDFNPDRPMTRAQDEAAKLDTLRAFKAAGLTVGSEEVGEFACPTLDWFESRHRWVRGESVPLWHLVYGDAAVHVRITENPALGPEANADFLWGKARQWWGIAPEQWEEVRPGFLASAELEAWHERVATQEMVNHEYLADDWVERTTFADGSRCTVNFGEQAVEVDGAWLEPGAKRLDLPQGPNPSPA